MGCFGGKYLNNINSTDFYDLKCSEKESIAQIWEGNEGKQIADQTNTFACLNEGCKNPFGKWVEQKMINLVIIGFV